MQTFLRYPYEPYFGTYNDQTSSLIGTVQRLLQREGEDLKAQYDAIIIGGGHNGLVTACYLAKAGWKVLVLERRYVVGGACVTEEVFPGFKVSTAAYVNSLFRPEIIRDLRLGEYGFEAIERNPASFSPFPRRALSDARCGHRTKTSKRSPSSARTTPRTIRGTRRCSSASHRSSSRR